MRRIAICLLLIACCWQLRASSAPRPQQRQDTRPNILFCFADDWGRYASIYATLEKQPSLSQVVKTPNIDRVAREGVLFRRAFVNAPSCTPSRSALLSGRYFFNTGRGAILHTAQWDSSIPSFPHLLRDAGYHIGETYKVWSPGAPVDAPFSGDHGMPGVTNGKCNLYDFGTGVTLAARWPRGIKGKGRVVDDLVSLPDLMPTFLEAAGVAIPEGVNARSLMNVLRSDRNGQVDASRTWVISGRERHVAFANADNRPYPQRALRTTDYLYIRNFAPDRWPLGIPVAVTETSAPSQDELESVTYAAFADMDASPTKAWLVAHRNDTEWKRFYDIAFARRPAEELYDLRRDPHQTKNVAADSKYAATKSRLAEQLMKILKDAGDPRVTGDGQTFERPPFTNPSPQHPPQRGQSR